MLALDAGEQIPCLSGTDAPRGELTTGHVLAAASGDAVYLFDAGSGERLRKLSGHGFRVRNVAFSGDARHLVAGDWSGQLRVWSIASGELVVTFHRLPGESSVVVSGGRCYALGEDVDLRRWFGTIVDACRSPRFLAPLSRPTFSPRRWPGTRDTRPIICPRMAIGR